jgi:hypothetical protein
MAFRRTWTNEEVAEYVRRSRREQGLPEKVEDPAFYELLADCLAEVETGAGGSAHSTPSAPVPFPKDEPGTKAS